MRAREIARRLRAFLDDPRDTSWGRPLSNLAERAMRAVAADDRAAMVRRHAELAIAYAPIAALGPCGALMLETLNWRLPEDRRVEAAEKLWKLLMQTPPDVAWRLDNVAKVYAAIALAHRKRARSRRPGIATEKFELDLRRQLFEQLRQRIRDERPHATVNPLAVRYDHPAAHEDPFRDQGRNYLRAVAPKLSRTTEDLAIDLGELTPREHELALLLADGITIAEAAEAMNITEPTATRLLSRLRANLS
jgi:hypothetical protein